MMMHSNIRVKTVFSQVKHIEEHSNSNTVTKSHYKYGNLQIYTYLNDDLNNNGLRENIPNIMEMKFLKAYKN